MKRIVLLATALFLAAAFSPSLLRAQQQPVSREGWYCPWMGRDGGAASHGGGCCGWWAAAPFNRGRAITKDQAKQMLDNYLRSRNDPNLKIGDVTDKGDYFEAAITAKDGSRVEKIQVDKQTGWFKNIS